MKVSKDPTLGASNAGNERYSEYYAAQITQVLGMNTVEYGLSKNDVLVFDAILQTGHLY